MIRPFLILLLLSSGAAWADERWSNQYLANFGGTRNIVVNFDERQMTEAFIDNSAGVQVRVGCRIRQERYQSSTIGIIAFARTGAANGPFIGGDANIIATFDDEASLELGQFDYARGAYWGDLAPQTIAMLVSHHTLSLRDAQSDFAAEFPLAGAGFAISKIECQK